MVRVTPELYAKVVVAAEADDRSLADVVRRALVEYFDGPESC